MMGVKKQSQTRKVMFVVVSLTPLSLSTHFNKAILIGLGHAMQFRQRAEEEEKRSSRDEEKEEAVTQKGQRM